MEHTDDYQTRPLPDRKRKSIVTGVFFLSFGLVALEIILIRILSIRNHYHLAFLLISLAMLGLGASGSYLAVSKSSRTADPVGRLIRYSVLFALSCLLFTSLGTRLPTDPLELLYRGWWALPFFPLYSLMMFLPFFFAGAAIGVALFRFPFDVNRIYFADLCGAGLGCLGAVPLVIFFGAGGAVVGCAAFGLVGAVFFNKAHTGSAGLAIPLLLIILVGALPFVAPLLEIEPGTTKFSKMIMTQNPDARTVRSQWTATGRVDVQELDAGSKPFMILGAGSKAEGQVPRQKLIHVDAEATTQLNEFDGDFDKLKIIDRSLYSAAYQVLDKPEVLIIGVGGGTDVLAGLRHEARHITGVELNRPTIKAVAEWFNDFAGGIYNHPKVTILHGEGRAMVRREGGRYDLIQLTGVDTHAALASGAYTLSENYLYTKEAMADFLQHLKPGGVLSFMRWIFDPPRESLRLTTMAAQALKELELGNPADCIAVLRAGKFGSVLIKPGGFTSSEVDALERFVLESGMLFYHLPGRPEQANAFSRFLHAKDPERFFQEYDFNVRPASDDAPFFYNYYRWRLLSREKYGQGGPLLGHVPVGQIVLLLTAVQGVVLGLVLIIIPLMFFRRRDVQGPRKISLSIYFSALGLGFMFIELAALQKFILFLHHPGYAASVVLFAMLVFAGLGSFFSGRWKMSPQRSIWLAVAGLLIGVGFYIFGLDPLLRALLFLPLWIRIPIAVALLAPLGFVLGIPFPAGLALTRKLHPGFVAWAWGINGCMSVIGAIGAVLLAMELGFGGVFAIAAALYLLAALITIRLAR